MSKHDYHPKRITRSPLTDLQGKGKNPAETKPVSTLNNPSGIKKAKDSKNAEKRKHQWSGQGSGHSQKKEKKDKEKKTS